MHVDVRKRGDVVIADIAGRLVAGIGDEILREVINELIAEGWKKVLLNLSGVSIVDSAGIGELVASQKLCHNFGVQLKLMKPSTKVRETLRLGALLPAFHVFEEEDGALAAFAEPVRQ